MRVALYARVSTDEQAKHGLSIDTQLDNLREWATNNKHTIVAEYVDAGISGKKPYTKRPELSRFMNDIQAGMKVDALCFTKIDRFFRSVKHYYQAISVLDKCQVSWVAIQEDYETLTSAGRFKVNIMLSISEAEADRTSERIKVVMERKAALGEHLGPRPPLGYNVVDKHLIPDENADIARGTFRAYLDSGSVRSAMDYLHEHGFPFIYDSVKKMLSNPIYKGQYRGNLNYCTPIIQTEDFDRVQTMLQERSTRKNQTGRVYVFSGMITCGECGSKLVSAYHYKGNEQTKWRYRCDRHYLHHLCNNKTFTYEYDIEQLLLDGLENALRGQEVAVQPKPKRRPKTDNTKKLERLNELYIEGLITKPQLIAKRNQLLSEPTPTPPPDPAVMQKISLSDKNIRERYYELTRQERQMLWRNMVESIVVMENVVDITWRQG